MPNKPTHHLANSPYLMKKANLPSVSGLSRFGTGQRFNTDKLYLTKQLSNTYKGRLSPGPIYLVEDNKEDKFINVDQ